MEEWQSLRLCPPLAVMDDGVPDDGTLSRHSHWPGRRVDDAPFSPPSLARLLILPVVRHLGRWHPVARRATRCPHMARAEDLL